MTDATDHPSPADLQATPAIDADHPAVRAFAQAHASGQTARERAVSLAMAVRNQIRYDPYRLDLSPPGMRGSTCLQQGYGWCVTKAVLLAAACRAVGIPARLGFADVRNHLSTERMRQTMKTDVFAWHGYTDIWLDGAWRKATPAFNLSLCEKFGLLPLDFDGVNDAIYHPFDKQGNRHMEYLLQRGTYSDLPLDAILATFHTLYGAWLPGTATLGSLAQGDFLADVAQETGTGNAVQ